MSQINSGILTSERFYGFSPRFAQISTFAIQQLNQGREYNNVANLTHPLYESSLANWQKWRLIYDGGDAMIDEYVKHFSAREEVDDFKKRKEFTPTPTFAKAAVNEIKNAIFQRMADVSRKDGPQSYLQAVEGQLGGVDLRGSKMNWFIGHNVLPELLAMSKVGIYVDNFELTPGSAITVKGNRHPYLYVYRAEDIRSWTLGTYGEKTEFTSLLLRDYNYIVDKTMNLPIGEVAVFRYLWIAEDGKVHVQFYDQAGNLNGSEIVLTISQIPFVVGSINNSLLNDVANHQIALLNLESADIAYILKGNFPFYVEQYDPANNSTFTKSAQDAYIRQFQNPTNADGVPVYVTDEDGITRSTLGSPASLQRPSNRDEVEVGATQGRRYPLGTDAPKFIAPPVAPITASILKQDHLKEDIRNLVALAVSNTKSKGVSAESKAFDQQGLEAGLSYIGLELENIENTIAAYWAMYENFDKSPSVRYPKHYSLKSPEEIEKEIKQALAARSEIPSKTFKAEMNKEVARLMLQTKVSDLILEKIYGEIEGAEFYSSNPKDIGEDVKQALVSVDTASRARGWPKGEADKAANDHAEKLARIAIQQTDTALNHVALKQDEAQLQNPAARGVPELSATPSTDASAEKVGKPSRGLGRKEKP